MYFFCALVCAFTALLSGFLVYTVWFNNNGVHLMALASISLVEAMLGVLSVFGFVYYISKAALQDVEH